MFEGHFIRNIVGQCGFGVRKSQARQQTGATGHRSQLNAARVIEQCGQMAHHGLRRLQGQTVRNRIGIHIPYGLQGMRQSIQIAVARHRVRQGQGQGRVDQGGFGPSLRQVQGVFLVLGGSAVPQSGPGRDLTAGAGRGGHRNHGQGTGDGGCSPLGQCRMDLSKITAGHARQKHFGAVEHRTTAHRHHHAIGVLLPK